jgi:endonuclease I
MCSTVTRCFVISVFVLLSFVNVFPQDTTYYSTVSVTSPTFVADLEARVRSPFLSRTYTEFRDIMIPNYESVPTGVGTQRMVTCAYSGFLWTYTPPFAFGSLFSREHTYCQSWWEVSSTSNPYYSDFHHLFLTQQPNANALRSNHPLGNVATPTTTFLECKLGKNLLGQTVFEPRASDKGDAARGMMYMVVMYDLNGSYGNWSFKWLNEVKLPHLSIPEAPEDVQTLLNWSKQDPPDKWEVERNNYIASLQLNRNPFVDHPEYLKYINLYDMTRLNPVFSPEPAYQVSGLLALATNNSITLNWTNPSAGQLPSGYLILAYAKDNYFIPCDGDAYRDTTTLDSTNTYIVKAVVNVPFSTNQSYTFNNLSPNTQYYFTMYSYNGSDTLINYKIDGKQRTNTSTGALPVELVSFTAAAGKDAVTLAWKTATELNNTGFDIQRGSEKNREGEIIFNKIAFVKGAGNSTALVNYSYSDKLTAPGKYYYRLKQTDYDGTTKLSPVVEVNFKALVNGYYLEQNYPNPFNPSTTISYSLPVSSNVKLSVFNTLGQQVKVIENDYKNAGNYQVSFSADDLNSGIYFYKIEAGQFSQTRKMNLLK